MDFILCSVLFICLDAVFLWGYTYPVNPSKRYLFKAFSIVITFYGSMLLCTPECSWKQICYFGFGLTDHFSYITTVSNFPAGISMRIYEEENCTKSFLSVLFSCRGESSAFLASLQSTFSLVWSFHYIYSLSYFC